LLDLGLLTVTVFVYYSAVVFARIIAREWIEIRQEDAEKNALRAARHAYGLNRTLETIAGQIVVQVAKYLTEAVAR
jgi:ABC-type dipeptide/oligopeptide/nickel transport system permease component